jgi:hypothetical protein
MKYNDLKTFQYAAVLSGIMVICCLAVPAYCQDEGTALMMQLSPVEGGKVHIEQGVHMYDRDSEVTLKATPNPGYQFVYWVGNVAEPTSSSTSVRLDGPKIVIAVFEKSRFEISTEAEPPQIPVSQGGMYRSRVERGSDTTGEIVQHQPGGFHLPKIPHNVPVPGGNDQPVPNNPTPEPSTVLLLAGGAMFALNKRSRSKNKCIL